ncbi:MAG TPA: type II toxin-antitoxin system VapC family toxin [Chloroflexota bacterium]|nr:type II toxin-antitoxin system VapC family toxin [Chloroflexota bacterium]
MIVLDASVWVSALVESDVHYAASEAWLSRWMRSGATIIAPALMLAEVAGAISRRGDTDLDGRKAISILEALPGVQWVYPDHPLRVQAAELAADLSRRGADATYVAIAQRFDVSLLTWDQDQAARARPVVRVERVIGS